MIEIENRLKRAAGLEEERGQLMNGSEGTVRIRPHRGGGEQPVRRHNEYQDHGSELRRRIRKGVG